MRYATSLFCTILLVWSFDTAVAQQEEAVRASDNLVGPWQLFIDDHLVASKTNVLRRYHSFRKHPDNPLIVVDRPWEAHVVNNLSVLPGEDGTGLRMYYYCWTPDNDPARSRTCLAVSRDGVNWEKPNLGLFEWSGDGTKNNNIVPNAPGSIFRTPWETDPNRKYQGYGGGGGYVAKASPDGLHWKTLSEEPAVRGGDTSYFYWDPHTGRFRCHVKVGSDVTGLRRRCVGFSETNDITRFPPLRLNMAPDDKDDLWVDPNMASYTQFDGSLLPLLEQRPGWQTEASAVARTHFYGCSSIPYETMYVGMLQIYRAHDPEGYFHGPLWMEVVSSRDGFHWHREEGDRPPILGLGRYREFDDGMVISRGLISVGDEIWMYYTGYEELHDLLPYKAAIGLATLRKDGFASLDADEAPGEILTKPLADAADTLQVNYNARGGRLRVEVLDADHNVIPGYGRDDCEPLTGDAVCQDVVWRTKKTLPADRRPIRLRFLLEHVRLYSFMAGENARVIDECTDPPLQVLFTFEGDTEAFSDMLWGDGIQLMRNLGTCRLDHRDPQPAFGKRALIVGSTFRPLNRVAIEGTRELGRHFTLAAMVKSDNNKHARLFSAYRGNYPVNTSELVFDFDPASRIVRGLRLFCKGIDVQSDTVAFDDGEYHHLAVVYDDGEVNFYLDGDPVGQRWLPGGDPVRLARNLLVGEDLEMGSECRQLRGRVDDLFVLGVALSAEDMKALADQGAEAFFAACPELLKAKNQ